MAPLRRLLLLLVVPALAALALPVPAQAVTAAASAPTAGQSTYVALEPVRLLDTRTSGGRLGAGGTVDVDLSGRVPSSARAVVLNLTGLGASTQTDLRAYPAGSAVPAVAQVPVAPGAVAADLAVVPVGADRRVRVRNAAGLAHLLVDLTGYYAEQDGPGYVAATPRRLLDTRTSGGALGAGQVRTLQVTGGDVPAGATAAVLSVTALGATRQTDVRVYPAHTGPPPTVSLTNPTVGRPTNAVAIATLSPDGRVSLRNGGGSVQLVVDLQGWYVPGAGAVYHPLPASRLLSTTLSGGTPQDLLVAGPGAVPAQATAVALTLTVQSASPSSDVRVYPATGGAAPEASNVYAVKGAPPVANAVVTGVGRSGAVSLRTSSGSTPVTVDLAGWWGPRGRGWDISWPQCTTAGATTSRLPSGGAFAVVGLNRRVPFTDNECVAVQWQYASSLPAEPAVYLNIDAPGSGSPHWTDPGPRAADCSGASSDSDCAYDYGWSLAGYALDRMPTTPSGGRPFVWFDVENGPVWQNGSSNPNAVAVNRNVLDGAAARLRDAGVPVGRYGVYTDAGPRETNDWVQIMGDRTLRDLPLWVFRAPTADPRPLCTGTGVTGGPVQLVQVQPEQSGEAFDVDDLC